MKLKATKKELILNWRQKVELLRKMASDSKNHAWRQLVAGKIEGLELCISQLEMLEEEDKKHETVSSNSSFKN